MAQIMHVFGCRNPNASSVTDARQYMFWCDSSLHEVIFDGQCDYMNTETLCSPIPSFEHYKSLISRGWTPMTRDELNVHFPKMTDRTWVGVPSRWNPIYMFFAVHFGLSWCCNKVRQSVLNTKN